MITQSKWIAILTDYAHDMVKAGTVYNWVKPINPQSCLKHSTCIGYVASCLQLAGLIPHNGYVYLDSNRRLTGNAADFVKNHKDRFRVIRCGKPPQNADLRVGDVCLYTTHTQVFAGWRGNTPLWYSLEHKSGQKKAILTIKGVFGFYSKRRIDVIIRPLFKDAEPDTKPDVKPKKSKRYKVKTKQQMNIRQEPNADSLVIGHVPKGKVKTVWAKKGSWGKVKQSGQYGWMNISDKYVEVMDK